MPDRPLEVRITRCDYGYLLGAALRYQLGRATYGSAVVADCIRRSVTLLAEADRAVMAREITEARDAGRLGHDCDAAEWLLTLHALTETTHEHP